MNNRGMEARMKSEERETYRIALKGELDPSWSDWLNGYEVDTTVDPDGISTTILAVRIADQAALRGILNKIWDFNLEIIALQRIDNPLTEPSPKALEARK
jgi:hypothetical protein